MPDAESFQSDAVAVPRSGLPPNTPDEAIAGRSFTLLEAGLLGPVEDVLARVPIQRRPAPQPEPPLRSYLEGAQPGMSVGGGVAYATLTVQEEDGAPNVSAVDLIRVPNGTLTDLGNGDVSLNYESPINKNVANGYAGLDAGARIAKAQAPSTTLYSDGALASTATTNTQITSDQNDYAIGAGTFFRLSSDAARTITGMTGGTDGKLLFIRNVGSFNILFANESASSAAANRIITGTGGTVTLAPNQMLVLIYDATTQRWQVW